MAKVKTAMYGCGGYLTRQRKGRAMAAKKIEQDVVAKPEVKQPEMKVMKPVKLKRLRRAADVVNRADGQQSRSPKKAKALLQMHMDAFTKPARKAKAVRFDDYETQQSSDDAFDWSCLRALELILNAQPDRSAGLKQFRGWFSEGKAGKDAISSVKCYYPALLRRIRAQLRVRDSLCFRAPTCPNCEAVSQLATICSSCGGQIKTMVEKKQAALVEAAAIRGLDAVQRLLKAKKNLSEFDTHGGDALFLFRYVVQRTLAHSGVHKRSKEVCLDVMKHWDTRHKSLDAADCTAEHMLVFAEATHAKLGLFEGGPDRERLDELRDALAGFDLGEVLAFCPEKLGRGRPLYLPAGHCSHCGRRNPVDAPDCARCKRDLRIRVIDYQSTCFAVVWAGLFKQLGQDPMRAADANCCVEDVLATMPHLRPYGSIDSIGEQAFKAQGYFVTHLLFVMSDWGAFRLDADVFAEELLFLSSQLDTAVRLGDPELVGEFLQCLRILGVAEDSHPIRRGVAYLLGRERSLKCKGIWVKPTRKFFQHYHAIYCALIGLLPFEVDHVSSLNQSWRDYFI